MAEFRTAPQFVRILRIGGTPPIDPTSCDTCPPEAPVHDVLEVI